MHTYLLGGGKIFWNTKLSLPKPQSEKHVFDFCCYAMTMLNHKIQAIYGS